MGSMSLDKDFAVRTMANLTKIEEILEYNPDADVYEVTQLVNSLLGLLVMPKERAFGRIEKIPLAKLRNNGWSIPEVKNTHQEPDDLHQFVRKMRNAIAHFHIEFINENYQIAGIRLWNSRYGPDEINWEMEFTIAELRNFIQNFYDYFHKIIE